MLKKLLEKRAALLARGNELAALAEKGPLTDEQRAEFQKVLADSKALKIEIDSLQELERAEDEQRAAEALVAAGERTRADQVHKRPGGGPSVHDNAEDKPWERGFGEFLLAVRSASADRGAMDPRLRKHDIRNLEVRAAAGLNETVAAEGGFLVAQDVGTTLMQPAFDLSQVWNRASDIPISANSNSLKYPTVDETSRANGSRWGGVRTYWMNEADALTATKPKFGQSELSLQKLGALVYMTDELLMDSTAAEAYTRQAFTDEFSFALDDAAIRGSGAGVPLGILNAACTVSVAKESGQLAATIVFENVSKMRLRMLPRSFQGAVWYVNVDTLSQLEKMYVKVKNEAGTENVGGFGVFMPPGGISGQPYGSLYGRPVIPIEHCETLGTVGDIILADMGMYLTISKGGLMGASSIHVNFLTDETAFRFIMRVNGQPKLKSAITPFKGTGTLSSFVTLATRA